MAAAWWKRIFHWRRNKGYGVHSPFAFNFITGVIRNTGYHYYGYAALDDVSGKERKRARLLFRIACRFNPREVLETGSDKDCGEWVKAALLLHDSRTRIVTAADAGEINSDRVTYRPALREAVSLYAARIEAGGHTPFVIINAIESGDDATVLLSFLSGCLPTGAVVIVRNRRDNESVLRKVIGLMSRGMVFTDRDSAVIVTRPDLPKQFFKVDL